MPASCKGVFKLQDVRDQILSNEWVTYSDANDPFSMYLAGDNLSGQMGLQDRVRRSSPTQLPGAWLNKVTANQVRAFGIKSNGTLWGWGNNDQNQFFPLTDLQPRSSPVQIPGTTWCHVSGYNDGVMAIKSDNTMWGWGYSASGELGLGNTITYSSPVQIPGTTWCNVDNGPYHGIGSKTDGTLWAWGYSTSGQLGLNCPAAFATSSPIQIPGTTWCKAVATEYTSGAIKSDGTLWMWGNNSFGGVGNGTMIPRSSPVQVPGTTWANLSSTGSSSAAIKTDGTLWAWGYNATGEAGQNTSCYCVCSPVQIPGTTWCAISHSCQTVYALKTDSTLWVWGEAGTGRLGDGTVISKSSPIQIPGTWCKLPASSTIDQSSNLIAFK